MSETKKSSGIRYIGWGIMGALILVFVLVAFLNKHADNRLKKEEMIAAELKFKDKEAQLAEKYKEEKNLHDKKYIEAEARKRVGMVKPGEVPIIVQQDNRIDVPNPDEAGREQDVKKNKNSGFQTWLNEIKGFLGRAIFGNKSSPGEDKRRK
ncbi:MAG: septum formation initiator family protein [Chloroflexi bacterium]|nr:septum formation initiator family protein [Chloroflexota bacterium]